MYRFQWTKPDSPGIWQRGMKSQGKVMETNVHRLLIEDYESYDFGWWVKLMPLPVIEQPGGDDE